MEETLREPEVSRQINLLAPKKSKVTTVLVITGLRCSCNKLFG